MRVSRKNTKVSRISLTKAIKKADFKAVKNLLKKGANPHEKDSQSWTPLHIASHKGLSEIVKLLLVEHKVEINCKLDSNLKTALHFAVKNGHFETVKVLLNSKQIDVNAKTKYDTQPLHIACENGFYNIAQDLIYHGAEINSKASDLKLTPLMLAIQNGNLDMVKLLLANGAEFNVQANDEEKSKPLDLAIRFQHLEIINCLVKIGASAKLEVPSNKAAFVNAIKNGHFKTIKALMKSGESNQIKYLLYHAVVKGQVQLVQCLIENGFDVNAVDLKTKEPPIIRAVDNENVEMVKVLVKSKALNVNVVSQRKRNPLLLAARSGNLDIIKMLLAKAANVNFKNCKNVTALYCSVYYGHAKVAQELITHGADINERVNQRGTYLHLATRFNHVDVVKVLVENGAAINVEDHNKDTPLLDAVNNGKVEITKLLLKHGANVNFKDNDYGRTALHHACTKNGHPEIIKLLIQHGVDLFALDSRGLIPLHYAASNNNIPAAEILIENGADVNFKSISTDYATVTALHLASKLGHIDMVKFLIKNGVNCNLQTSANLTSLHLLAYTGNIELAEILLKNGANVNSQLTDKTTPLHMAIKYNNVEIVKLFLNHGANLKLKGGSLKMMPIDFAKFYHRTQIVRHILQKMIEDVSKNDDEQLPQAKRIKLDECWICYNPRNNIWAFGPCGHAKTCEACCLKLFYLPNGTPTCPVCREEVKDFMKICY